ncbi:Uncharacterised protein [Mycobacterium tuberculosis]|uniref:Uncharacterized protein n=1 Tax=Mycobacterium tuberculosis TaxID=1773 RepID=A0A916LEL0_MYCTX|nr:Uncharacterised protein [Mycobacterium tuberculosis]COZ85820.1 Uncharacterised protein [Mycobacterium tuberculosis]
MRTGEQLNPVWAFKAFDDAQHRVDCGAHPVSCRIGGQIVRYGVSSLSSQRDRLVRKNSCGAVTQADCECALHSLQ